MTDWSDKGRRKKLLDYLRILESEPSLYGASDHLMAICRKPDPVLQES